MRQIIFILTLILILLICSSKTGKSVDFKSADILQTILTDQKQSEIFIKDKSKYSKVFIEELTASNYKDPIKIIDNIIIVGADTTMFPADLTINKATVFKASNDNKNYVLTLTRINQTTISFAFQLTDMDKNLLYSETGDANLGALFFLASEVDEDDQTGEAYMTSEYWDKSSDCWFSLSIGIGKDKNGKQRARIIGCAAKNNQSLKLDECPILRTE